MARVPIMRASLARVRQWFGNVLGAASKEERFNANERKWPQMNANGPVLDAISNRIIGCAFTVANTLGAGFLEKVYENALAVELRASGFAVEQQRGMNVSYKDVLVGEYFTDLLVEGVVVVELKTVQVLNRAHRAQCINYLRATGLHLCLLINFGAPRLEVRRVVQDL
jgi:GxxExxY protein